MLNNHATIADETLFAATIILRVLEEIDSESGLVYCWIPIDNRL